MPTDDEQPVVDADAEADQDGQLAGNARDVKRVGEQFDERRGCHQRQAGSHQGQQRGQQRPAEDDQQDDQRRSDSDHDGYPDARAFRGLDGLAAERDVHVWPVRGFRRADQFPGVGCRHLGRWLIPGHAGEGDGAVPADLRRPVTGVRADDALDARHLGHLGQRRGHRGLHRGGLDGGAVLSLDHDLVALTGGGREILCQESGGRLRIGTRQAVIGVETAAGGHADPGDDRDRQQPCGHDLLAVPEAPATQSGHGNLHGKMCGNVPRTRTQCFRPDGFASWAYRLDLASPG